MWLECLFSVALVGTLSTVDDLALLSDPYILSWCSNTIRCCLIIFFIVISLAWMTSTWRRILSKFVLFFRLRLDALHHLLLDGQALSVHLTGPHLLITTRRLVIKLFYLLTHFGLKIIQL